jgi:pyridoxine kinase
MLHDMRMQRHVLSISSQVAYGPVGNTAAVPALHAAGFTVLQVPTIILSHHPGFGKPAGVRLPAQEIGAILAGIDAQGMLAGCVGALTGYFASADQVKAASHALAAAKARNPALLLLVDPVFGDDGRLYVGQDVAEAMRDELFPLADIITPNAFELAWLAGRTVSNSAEAQAAAAALGGKEIVVKSVPGGADNLLTLAIRQGAVSEVANARHERVPHGTGDFLAGLYLGARLNGYAPPEALNLSSAILTNAIERSLGQATLDVIGALHGTG